MPQIKNLTEAKLSDSSRENVIKFEHIWIWPRAPWHAIIGHDTEPFNFYTCINFSKSNDYFLFGLLYIRRGALGTHNRPTVANEPFSFLPKYYNMFDMNCFSANRDAWNVSDRFSFLVWESRYLADDIWILQRVSSQAQTTNYIIYPRVLTSRFWAFYGPSGTHSILQVVISGQVANSRLKLRSNWVRWPSAYHKSTRIQKHAGY